MSLHRARFSAAIAALLVACSKPAPPPSSRAIESPSASESRASPPAAPTSAYVEALRKKLGTKASLTLDAPLQAAAESALAEAGKPGAVVAFEPKSGTVRALYSVAGDRGDPLLAAHVPASTFKTFAAIAGLESGVLTPTSEHTCDGTFAFGGKVLRCADKHGKVTTADSITRSCNVFYYWLGTQIDHAKILEIARRFGLGSRTGIELADEAGIVPDQARYEALKRDPKSTVPLLDASGHGEVQVTLLQLARAFAVIANGGTLVKLHVTSAGEVERNVALRPADLALVRQALLDVVESDRGRAHAYAINGLPYAGKTGSSEAPPIGGVEADDIWFVAYAPAADPKILVGARVERAAPDRDARLVVRKLLEAWRSTQTKPD